MSARPRREPMSRAEARRFWLWRLGAAIGAILDLVGLYVVNHLTEREWPSFLTAEFDDVVPLASLALVASFAMHIFSFAEPQSPPVHLTSAVSSGLNLVVAVQLLDTFPFDFSTWDRDWSWAIRFVLVLAIVGAAIGGAVSTVRLIAELVTDDRRRRGRTQTLLDAIDSERDRSQDRRRRITEELERIDLDPDDRETGRPGSEHRGEVEGQTEAEPMTRHTRDRANGVR